MESPWRRIFSIFIILYFNVVVISQNVPVGLPLPPLQQLNKDIIKPIGTSQLLNTVLSTSGANGILPDVTSLVRTPCPPPENQRGALLQDGIGPPIPPISVPPQILPPFPLPPPIFNSIPQGPLGPMPLGPLYPGSAHVIPGIPPSLSMPGAPIVPELPAVNCPPLTLGNRMIPFQPPQVPVEALPNPGTPNVCLPPTNVLQNLPAPRPGPAIIPFSQPLVTIDNSPRVSSLPHVCPPLSTVQMPSNYPINIPPGTATIVPSEQSQYPAPSTNFRPVLPDINLPQPGYQVTILPPVYPVQSTSESVNYQNSYLNPPASPVTEVSGQIPINLQITLPEQPAPMPLPPQSFPPPYAMPPIIVMKSGSSWKKWFPSLLVTLLTNCRGRACGGCCHSSSCDCSDNVYLPFPIPIPTNNPIVLSGNSKSDNIGEGDEEYDDCED